MTRDDRWAKTRNEDWKRVRDELAKLPGAITLSQLAVILPLLPEWTTKGDR